MHARATRVLGLILGLAVAIGVAAAGQCGSEVEPNDSASAADELASIPGVGCRRGSIVPSGDVDVYEFAVGAAARLVLETRTSGDTILSVYDGSGRLLAQDDDGGEGGGSRIEGVVLEPGAYLAVVSGYGEDIVPSYELWIRGSASAAPSVGDAACPAEVEGNDSASLADALIPQNGVACRSGMVSPVGDVDVYGFELTAPQGVVIETTTVGDTILRLYDARGEFLAEDDDGGIDAASRLAGTLAAGRYYVTVREYGDDDVVSSYRITLTVGGSTGATSSPGTPPPPPPPGGVAAGAPPWGWSIWGGEVVLSAWGAIERDCPSDYDFNTGQCDKKSYTFTLTSPGFVALALIDAPGQWITAYVYDAGGRRVAMKLGVSAPIYSGWFEVPAGTYRVDVVPGKRLDKSSFELHVFYRATQPTEGYLINTYGPADRQLGR